MIPAVSPVVESPKAMEEKGGLGGEEWTSGTAQVQKWIALSG